jgi:hypothetical protein
MPHWWSLECRVWLLMLLNTQPAGRWVIVGLKDMRPVLVSAGRAGAPVR